MADNLESGVENEELVRNMESKPSTTQRDQQTSESLHQSEPLLSPELEERLGARIAEEVERRFQSAKDRRWAKLERQFGTLSDIRKSIKGSAEEVNDAVIENQSEDWLARKTHDLLESAGLSNDPEALELFRDGDYNPDVNGYLDLLGDITKLAVQRASRPKVSAGSLIQPSGGGALEPDLRGQYDERKAHIRPGNVNALMELKREFRQKGLEVY